MFLYSGPGFWGEPLTATLSPHVDAQHQTDGNEGNGCDLHSDRLRADNAAEAEGDSSQEHARVANHGTPRPHGGQYPLLKIHELIGWRYALMRRMAIRPNVHFEFIDPDMPDSEISFTRSWVDWAARNADFLFQKRNLVFAGKDAGIDGYSHIIRDRGFFGLVNPGYATQTAELNLAALEIPEGGLYAAGIAPERRDLNGGRPLDAAAPLRIELAPMTVMIFQCGPKDFVAAAQPGQAMPSMPKDNYLRDWKVAQDGDATVFTGSFQMFPSLKEFLPKRDTTTPEEKWKAEPSGFRKVYLVLWIEPKGGLSKSRTQDEVADSVVSIEVNGKELAVHTPQPRRNAVAFRCFFADVGDVLRDGENRVKIRVLSPKGTARFRGAWLDWPHF